MVPLGQRKLLVSPVSGMHMWNTCSRVTCNVISRVTSNVTCHLTVRLHIGVDAGVLLLAAVEVGVRHLGI